MSSPTPPNDHWSPDQPERWAGTFGSPESDPKRSPERSGTGPDAPTIPGGQVPLRPLGVAETLGVTWQLVRRNFRACFAVAGTAAAIVGTIELIVLVTMLRLYPQSQSLAQIANEVLTRGTPITVDDFNEFLSSAVPQVTSTLTGIALLQVAAFLVVAVLSQVVAAAAIGKPIGASRAWQLTRPKSMRLLGLLVIVSVLIVAAFAAPIFAASATLGLFGTSGAAALVLGLGAGISLFLGIFVFVRLLIAPVVMSLESSKPARSIGRSFQLVKGSSWRVFWAYLLASLLANAVAFLVSFPFAIFAGDATTITSQSVFFNTAGSIVGYLVILGFVSVLLAVIYTDLRVRKEGLAEALLKQRDS